MFTVIQPAILLPALLIFVLTASHCPAAVEAPSEGRLDPSDQPFRYAPMTEGSRSLHLPLSKDLHAAFDTTLLRLHTVWKGAGLELHGPPFTGKKTPFLSRIRGEILFKNHALSSWTGGPRPSLASGLAGKYLGHDLNGSGVTLRYQLQAPGGMVEVTEQFSSLMIARHEAVVRRVVLAPSKDPVWLRLHAAIDATISNRDEDRFFEVGGQRILFSKRGENSVQWETQSGPVSFEEEFFTEESTEKAKLVRAVSGEMTALFLHCPPRDQPLTFEVLMIASPASVPGSLGEALVQWRQNLKSSSTVPGEKLISPPRWKSDPTLAARGVGDLHYSIESFPVPRELDFLVGGMDWLANGDLAVCTWPGEVYIVEKAQGPVAQATYRRFARGLSEPLGLTVFRDQIYLAQKPELTRLVDRDGDGQADRFESITSDWGYAGNYHSYAFGPLFKTDGDFFLFITGQRGRWDMPFVGWAVEGSLGEGRLKGFASGLRVPNGFTLFGPDNDLLVTDNQGNWVGTCKLNHLRQEEFYGFPSGQPSPREQYLHPTNFSQPVLWFPRKLAPSAGDLAVVPSQGFGPFAGQLLVGEFQNSLVLRAALEKVGGQWQGAVFPFLKGFRGAVNRIRFGPDGKLYVGGCKRAWATASPEQASLERVAFSGQVPFEMARVNLMNDGFLIEFTEPADSKQLSDLENYSISQFTHKYHAAYGSPEIDHEGRENSSTELLVESAVPSVDGKTVRLSVKNLKAGFVTAIRTAGLVNLQGKGLRNDTAYYTVNRLAADKK